MKNLDYEWIAEYFEREIHRLEKIEAMAREHIDLNQRLYDLYKEKGKAVHIYKRKIGHSRETLDSVVPRIYKLKEQLAIIRPTQ